MPQEERKRVCVCVCVCMRANAARGSMTSCLECCLSVQFLLVSHVVKKDNTVISKHLEIWG